MRKIIGIIALVSNIMMALNWGDKYFNIPRSIHLAAVIYLVIDFLKNKITININNNF